MENVEKCHKALFYKGLRVCKPMENLWITLWKKCGKLWCQSAYIYQVKEICRQFPLMPPLFLKRGGNYGKPMEKLWKTYGKGRARINYDRTKNKYARE